MLVAVVALGIARLLGHRARAGIEIRVVEQTLTLVRRARAASGRVLVEASLEDLLDVEMHGLLDRGRLQLQPDLARLRRDEDRA